MIAGLSKCKPFILNIEFTDFNFFNSMILQSIGITEQQNFSDEITRPIEKSVISTKLIEGKFLSSLVPTQEVFPKIQTNEDFRMYQYSGYDELKFKRFFRMIQFVRSFSCLKSWLQQSPKVSKYFFVHAKLQLNEKTARELMAYWLMFLCPLRKCLWH